MKKDPKLKILYLVSLLVLSYSCKKEESQDGWLLYKVYLDNQNRFLKVSEFVNGSGESSSSVYEYTDRTVVISDANARRTYFINDSKLADSCLTEDLSFRGGWFEPSTTYYSYNPDGYLDYSSDGFRYEYYGYNRSKALQDSIFFPYQRKYYYTYTTLANKIDIEHFNGDYLGKHNANLISEVTYFHGDLKFVTEYSYTLDPDNYVLKKTAISVSSGSVPDPPRKDIRVYEYYYDH